MRQHLVQSSLRREWRALYGGARSVGHQSGESFDRRVSGTTTCWGVHMSVLDIVSLLILGS